MTNLTKTSDDYARLALQCLIPSEAKDFWEWCSLHLVMPNGTRWDPRRAALMRHWYRIIGARLNRKPDPRDPYAHLCEQMYSCISAQLAKTAMLHAAILASMGNYQRQVGFFMSRKDDVKNARDRKLKRQVEKTACLEQLLPIGTNARDQALGSLSWSIGSSLLYFRSASVADDLRADPMDLIAMDEIETYPADVEGYGDPINQAIARQRTFRRSKLLLGVSTPGAVTGHAWSRLVTGTHERLLIPCPHCDGYQDLDPDRVCLTGDRKLKDVSPAEISANRLGRFVCKWCGTMITSSELHQAIRARLDTDPLWCPGEWQLDDDHPTGKWTPHADFTSTGGLIRQWPCESIIRSGQANALYSLDENIDSFAMQAASAEQGNIAKKKTFTNNECALPYTGVITVTDTEDISRDAQPSAPYSIGSLPVPATYLIIFFDQQGNSEGNFWYPYVVRAVTPGIATWLIEEGAAKNDAEADQVEEKTWVIGGKVMGIKYAIRDSANGNARMQSYLWAAKKLSRRFLIKGDSNLKPGIPWKLNVDPPKTRSRTPKPAGVKEYSIAPHYWRDHLWTAMKGEGAMKWYLPNNASKRYLASMTSEEQVLEQRRIDGRKQDLMIWRPRIITQTNEQVTYRDDNHWWDSEADLMAALSILKWDKKPPELPPANSVTPVIQTGFMTGFT